ncbi:MAG: DUF6688 family protein [Polyangiales bacterium]
MHEPTTDPRSPGLDLAGLAWCVAACALASPAALGLTALGAALGARGLLTALAICLGPALFVALLCDAAVHGPTRARRLVAFDVFVVLPAAGLGLAQTTLESSCVVDACSAGIPRPIHMPEGWGLLALHLASAVAWTVSRRRPEALRPRVEAAVLGAMLGGVALHAVLAVQFAPELRGALIPVLGWAVLSPYLALLTLGREVLSRLRRRGDEARAAAAPAEGHYRDPALPPTRGPRSVRPWLSLAAGPALVMIGAQAVLQALLFHDPRGLVWTFTQTCAGPLSTLTRVVEPVGDCHYLCTVAAQGHPWLVGPERMGVRHGHPVVVNRQLATANAFEDLLHTRWPRFGRLARRTYDALGYPVSRHLRARWLADAVYLAMKPAEWLFYLALLLLDPGDPEARLGRMYREECVEAVGRERLRRVTG